MQPPTTPLAALADPVRWQIVELLAVRPRPVGVLAKAGGLRQPQTTKHLQVLEQAGIVTVYRLGRRRVCALEAATLRSLGDRLHGLADLVDAVRGDRAVLDIYRDSIEAELIAADRDGWADGRSIDLRRSLRAPRALVWEHWTRADLLCSWWAPTALRVTECVFEPRPGGRVVLEYRDADDAGGVGDPVGRAEGLVESVEPGSRLVFRSSPLLPSGAAAFTARYEVTLDDAPTGTELSVHLDITDSTVDAAEFIAGIEIGWRQVLDNLEAVVTAAATTTPSRE
jgi:uncharacterized protein YndB with AHSA1/START domain/DNA-binding transcriptional ArsR family regulator